jgi:type IV pilus assembly protein PilM
MACIRAWYARSAATATRQAVAAAGSRAGSGIPVEDAGAEVTSAPLPVEPPDVAPARPGAAPPGDVAPGEVAPADVAPADIAPGEVAPAGDAPGDVAPGDVAPGATPAATPAAADSSAATKSWPQTSQNRSARGVAQDGHGSPAAVPGRVAAGDAAEPLPEPAGADGPPIGVPHSSQ